MLKLKKIAITGGLSCGKSSVCHFLKDLGAYVVNADDVVHDLLSFDARLGQKIIKLLGNKIVVDQKINRSLVAQIVFRNPDLLRSLEEILHPAVYQEIDRQYGIAIKASPQPTLFVAEIPLLFETNGQKFFDQTVVIMANKEACLKRFSKNHTLKEEEFEQRAFRQMDIFKKANLADEVICNDASLEDLRKQTKDLYQKLTGILKP